MTELEQKKLIPFKRNPQTYTDSCRNGEHDIFYSRKTKKGWQHVSMPFARGFNAAIREMERMMKNG